MCVCIHVCVRLSVYTDICVYMHAMQQCIMYVHDTALYMYSIILYMYDVIEIKDDVITTTGGHSYLIKKLIGSGAFANIYLAIDIHSGDKKALKVSD